ncbi:hypothetical protein ILUMI_25584 [Ignelater luminosus]|uniref:Uncharacterized protein n=1 Tax=Ignelater luminosus TaxID=2038154 RepID=A0A8K0FW70_IGNLU|nr:hypothetical protein ILUMI_25584 [Ignelater luminosus]
MKYAKIKILNPLNHYRRKTEISRINLVVCGLPIEIQEKIDREEVTTTEKLFNELRKLEDSFRKKKNISTDSTNIRQQVKRKDKEDDLRKKNLTSERKACWICELLGYPNRYHQPSECRNKNVYNSKNKVNMNEVADMMKIEVDSNSEN